MSLLNPHQIDSAQLSSLIGSIYEAALDPDMWPDLLLDLGKPINAHGGQLTAVSASRKVTIDSTLVGIDNDEANRQFIELVARGEHERVNFCSQTEELIPVYDYLHSSEAGMRRSTFYQEHATPCETPYYGATVLKKDKDSFYAIGLFRRLKVGHLQNDDVAYLALVAPHLRRSIELSIQLREKGYRDCAKAVIEQVECAAALVDSNGCVVVMNDAARRVTNLCDGIYSIDGRLVIHDKHAAHRLTDEMKSSLGTLCDSNLSGNGYISASRPSGATPFRLVVVPLGIERTPIAVRFCIVLIQDLDNAPDVPTGWLVNEFDLSPSERSVAAYLLMGFTLREIAEHRSCNVETVRTQVKAILKKTSTSRQAEFVSFAFRRILTLPKPP